MKKPNFILQTFDFVILVIYHVRFYKKMKIYVHSKMSYVHYVRATYI